MQIERECQLYVSKSRTNRASARWASMDVTLGRALAFSALLAIGLPLGACHKLKPKIPGAQEASARQKQDNAKQLKRACASPETYDRLKALTFDEVMKVRSAAPQDFDSVAANSTIRMENPVAKSRDEQLDITVCQGHLVLALPRGVQDAFSGSPQLEADVEYSAQAAADGSGLVYEMTGAEPIVYRLAALTLPKGSGRVAVASAPSAPARSTPEPAPVTVAAAPPPPPPVKQPSVSPPPRAPLPAAARAPAPVAERSVQAPGSARPSFSCARVTGRVLRMVCSEPGLASRDRRMSSQFYAALASGDSDTRAALRTSRDRFLRFRDRCSTSACVAQAYEDRIVEIRDIAAAR